MQSVSSGFHEAALARVRKPRTKLEIRWASTWVDESANVISWQLSQRGGGLGEELFDSGQSAAGHVVLRNRSWRYSAFASGGDDSLRSILRNGWGAVGKQVRLSVGFEVGGSYEYCRVLTGYITDLQENPAEKTVTLGVQDKAWILLQQRVYRSPVLRRSDMINIVAVVDSNYRIPIRIYRNPCVFIPFFWLDDDAGWSEILRVASATGGRVWIDAQGQLIYEHDSHLLLRTKSITLTPDRFGALYAQHEFEKLLDEVVVEYTPRLEGLFGVVYTHDKIEAIRPNETKQIELRLPRPVVTFAGLMREDYRIDNGLGMDMRDYVELGIQYAAQRVLLTLRNTHTQHIAYLRFLQIRGRPLVGGPTAQVRLSSTGNATRIRSVRGNEYVQTYEQAYYLADIARNRYSSMVPVWILRDLWGIPHLELYDLVGFYDNRAVGEEREGIVVGIEHRFFVSDAGPVYAQDLSLLDAVFLRRQPGENPFIIGVTALGEGVCWH